MRRHRSIVSIALAVTLAGASEARAANPCRDSVSTAVPQPTAAELAAAGLSAFPLAPDARRVDLVAPPFSSSTTIANPLFPISSLRSAILNGRVDGRPLKIETTLLPDTRMIEWSPGQCVRVLVSQFVAYRGGRIQEVALDFYAQADDGSVWYFGEDVFNYKRGVVHDTGGSWLAGRDGPAAMIMPAQPARGMVSRPENVPGLVFEEVTIKRTGVTVQGPRGPVTGAMIAGELHDDGSREDKYFAPGYGEFRSAGGGDIEAMALAVPTDALAGPPPAELTALHRDAIALLGAAGSGRWRAVAAGADRMADAWRTQRRRGVPPRLVAPLARALGALDRAVAARRTWKARHAALATADAALDLQLQYRTPAEIDRDRFELWARRARIDAVARTRPALRGDVATLTWIRDRIARSVERIDRVRIDHRLTELEAAVADDDLAAAAKAAAALRG
jgi:hypothetical protein